MHNTTANAVENEALRMSPIRERFSIQIFYKLSILDNITNLRVFSDDQQILQFMANIDIFKYAAI